MKDKISSEDYHYIWMEIYCGLLSSKDCGYNPSHCKNTANNMLNCYIKNLPSLRRKYSDEQQIIWTRFFIECIMNGTYGASERLIKLVDEAMSFYIKNIPELKKFKLAAFK